MRQTRTRQAIEDTLAAEARPMTLQEVYRRARRQVGSLNFSTVFRNIERLEGERAVRRIDWRERGAHYEWVKDRPHHHHVVCTSCGEMQELGDADISLDLDEVAAKTGFAIHDHTVELNGQCAACQTQNNSK